MMLDLMLEFNKIFFFGINSPIFPPPFFPKEAVEILGYEDIQHPVKMVL
jgi:hypothetical protein